MRYQISGKHLNVGTSLEEHVQGQIDEIITKYAERPTDAVITFSKDGSQFMCESSVHLSTGLSVNARAKAHEVYESFDSCAQRMEKQLRRYKRRLKDHHSKRTAPVEFAVGSSYTLTSESDKAESIEPDTLQPIIIAETETKILSLSVGEAVMQMELADESCLVFKNERDGAVNVVYRRKDGNIGWVNPTS